MSPRAERQVAGGQHRGAVPRVHQRRGVQHDVGVVGADVRGDVVHVRRCRGCSRSASGRKFSAWPTKSTANERTALARLAAAPGRRGR